MVQEQTERAVALQPGTTVTVHLTPQELAAIQAILNDERHLHSIFPLANGTITFDHYPFLGRNAAVIPSNTDLTQDAVFALAFGVTFSCDGCAHPRSVYAVPDFTGRSGNVVSVNPLVANSGQNPWFTASDGTIIATFNPPVRSASIDAYPADASAQQVPNAQPYIQGLDASQNEIPGARATYPSAGWAAGQTNPSQGPITGAWETMSISRAQADIHGVEISLTNTDCYAVFDNLSYQR
jgi:hypothetical protein